MGADSVLFKVKGIVAGRTEVGASLPQALRAIIVTGSMAGTTARRKSIPPHLISMPETIRGYPPLPSGGYRIGGSMHPPRGMAVRGCGETAYVHPPAIELRRGISMASLANIVAVTPDLAPVEKVLEGIIIDGWFGMRIVMTGETRLLIIFTIEIFSVAGLAGAFSLLKHEATMEPLGGGIRLPVRLVRKEDVAAAESVAGGLPTGGSDPALKIGSVAVLAVSEAHIGHIIPVEDERARTGCGLPEFAVAPKGGIPGRFVRAHRTIVAAPETP
jgi:hypothetical protein